jgi:hypothetical protein
MYSVTACILLVFPDVSVLGNLPYLIFLDLSYNKLTTILDFQPPKNLLVSRLA